MARRMYEKYQRMLNSGKYDNEEELCNGEGINYSDLYYDDSDSRNSRSGNYFSGGKSKTKKK